MQDDKGQKIQVYMDEEILYKYNSFLSSLCRGIALDRYYELLIRLIRYNSLKCNLFYYEQLDAIFGDNIQKKFMFIFGNLHQKHFQPPVYKSYHFKLVIEYLMFYCYRHFPLQVEVDQRLKRADIETLSLICETMHLSSDLKFQAAIWNTLFDRILRHSTQSLTYTYFKVVEHFILSIQAPQAPFLLASLLRKSCKSEHGYAPVPEMLNFMASQKQCWYTALAPIEASEDPAAKIALYASLNERDWMIGQYHESI